MNRRHFLHAVAGGAAGLAAAAVADPAADPITLSSTYYPDRWELEVRQVVTPLGGPNVWTREAAGRRPVSRLDAFPHAPCVYDHRPLVRKPGGGWWETVPDRTAPPQYFLVGPARLTVKYDGLIVADSGEGRHWDGALDGDCLFEWSKAVAGQPFDEAELVPLADQVAAHLSDAGYRRLFEIRLHDPLAAAVVRRHATRPTPKDPR